MLIYLDNCCYNRPFDDQSQLLISLQTEAKLFIQQGIKEGAFKLVWSAILDIENDANPDMERRKVVKAWRSLAQQDVETTKNVELLAEQYAKDGVKPMDALHVASAVSAGAEFFITTDKGILRKMINEHQITVCDPVDFLRHIEEVSNEN